MMMIDRDDKNLSVRQTSKTPMTTLVLAVTVAAMGCTKPKPAKDRASMIYIAGGSLHGHEIAPFYLDETEVTIAAFREWERASSWMGCGVSDEPTRGNVPIEVAWDHAKAYCEWRGARIPTELEWEWAARGREEAREFPWGSDEPSCAYAVIQFGCDEDEVWPVGSKPAGDTRDGLKDMAGNAEEWTRGVGEDGSELGVLRGGSYSSRPPLLNATRTSSRFVPSLEVDAGIRCAKSIEGQPSITPP